MEEYEEGEGEYREVRARINLGLEEEQATENIERILREEEGCREGGYLEESRVGGRRGGIGLKCVGRGNREESQRREQEER